MIKQEKNLEGIKKDYFFEESRSFNYLDLYRFQNLKELEVKISSFSATAQQNFDIFQKVLSYLIIDKLTFRFSNNFLRIYQYTERRKPNDEEVKCVPLCKLICSCCFCCFCSCIKQLQPVEPKEEKREVYSQIAHSSKRNYYDAHLIKLLIKNHYERIKTLCDILINNSSLKEININVKNNIYEAELDLGKWNKIIMILLKSNKNFSLNLTNQLLLIMGEEEKNDVPIKSFFRNIVFTLSEENLRDYEKIINSTDRKIKIYI